jgi:hypothetical protein
LSKRERGNEENEENDRGTFEKVPLRPLKTFKKGIIFNFIDRRGGVSPPVFYCAGKDAI